MKIQSKQRLSLSLGLVFLFAFSLFAACAPAPEEIAAVPPRRGEADVLGQVQEITSEILGVDFDAVTESADFRADLGATDAQMGELAAEFEQAFDIELSDAEVDGLTTVDSAVTLIESKSP